MVQLIHQYDLQKDSMFARDIHDNLPQITEQMRVNLIHTYHSIRQLREYMAEKIEYGEMDAQLREATDDVTLSVNMEEADSIDRLRHYHPNANGAQTVVQVGIFYDENVLNEEEANQFHALHGPDSSSDLDWVDDFGASEVGFNHEWDMDALDAELDPDHPDNPNHLTNGATDNDDSGSFENEDSVNSQAQANVMPLVGNEKNENAEQVDQASEQNNESDHEDYDADDENEDDEESESKNSAKGNKQNISFEQLEDKKEDKKDAKKKAKKKSQEKSQEKS